MALRIWLPLNGNLENKGISSLSLSATPTFVTGGKIGEKCLNSQVGWFAVPEMAGKKQMSFAYWVKINTETTTNWLDTFSWYTTNGSSAHRGRQEFYYFSNGAGKTGCWYYNNSNSGFDITVGSWDHYAFTIDFSTGISNFYKNGVLLRTTTNIDTTYYVRGTGNSFLLRESTLDCSINDFRLYDHILSPLEVKEISQGLVLHYKLSNSSITNFSETGNLIPNYKEMGLGTANVTTGTWRTAGTNNMTRTRVQIADSPVGECYCFQNSGIQTANDGSCYGIDNTTYFEPNTEYRISMFARITAGTEGYAGYNIYNISSELGGSHTKIDKNYRVTPLSADGSWTYCWYHFKTNSTATRNIYIGITTGETSVTTQMCLVRIEKWNEGMNSSIIVDSSGYGNNGIITGNVTTKENDSKEGRYNISTYIPLGSTDYITTQNPIGNPSDAITMNIWFKSNNTTPGNDYHEIFNHAISSQYFEFAIHKTGYFRQGMVINGTRYVANGGNGLLDGNWHMLTATYDGAWIKSYIDGINIVSMTQTVNGTLNGANGKFIFGHYGPNTGYHTKEAYLADARIYATALSAEDILDLYHTPANIDNLGGIHGFEFIEKTPNLLNPDPREWTKESSVTCVWNEETGYFDVNTNRDTSVTSRWGVYTGVPIKPNTAYLFSAEVLDNKSYIGVAGGTSSRSLPSNIISWNGEKRYYYFFTTSSSHTHAWVYLCSKPSETTAGHFKNIYLGEVGEIASIKQNGIFENEDMVEYNENGRITKSGELAGNNFIEK